MQSLRKGKADHASLEALIKDCATLEVEEDGLAFIADSVVAEDIAKDSEYKGTFGRVVDDVRIFALPALRSLASGERLTKQWKAGQGWVARGGSAR